MIIKYKQEDIFSLKKNNYKLPPNIETILNNLYNELNERNNKKNNNNRGNYNGEINGWRGVKEKYKSNFESTFSDDPIKKDLNSILNKISGNNIDTIKNKLLILIENNHNEYSDYIMDLILKNSIKQPLFCKDYVKLLVLLQDNDLIKSKCCNLFNELKNNNNKLFCEGYSLFIIEVYNSGILNDEDIESIITNIFTILNDNSRLEYVVDSLYVLFKFINNKKKLQLFKEQFKVDLDSLINNNLVPSKIKYKIMDINDL